MQPIIARYREYGYDREQNITLTFTISGAEKQQVKKLISQWEKSPEKPLSVSVKAYRPKRSIDSNSYMWILLGKLAPTLRTTANELYKKYIREIGSSTVLKMRQESYDKFSQGWGLQGIGWQTEILDTINSDDTYIVRAYYGSSSYTTEEMNALLDYIQDDCLDAGISIETPEQIAERESLEQTYKSTIYK